MAERAEVRDLQFSVLDQSPRVEGSTVGDALRNTIDLAKLAESLGYCRYWVAEHHGMPGLACSSPEVLIGPIAAATSSIRVGSGGVMLPHYSPLKIAETFGMLNGLFPRRIDLGIGRAAGTSRQIAIALQRDRRQPPPDDFREQLEELLQHLDQPGFEDIEPWLLGSSAQSALWAAELGLPYVFADFINAEGAPIAAHYRKHFRPSAWLKTPRVGVAAWTICAETRAEAVRLSSSARMMMLMLYRGRLIPVPPVERAEEFLRGEGLPAELLPAGRRMITGDPSQVRIALDKLAAEYGAEEVMVVNILFDHASRRRCYELIAQTFESGRGRPRKASNLSNVRN